MSIVPREVVEQWNDDWYAMQALRPSFRDYIVSRAAEWALEHAAIIAENTDTGFYDERTFTAQRIAAAIRALISPEGKIKGGESDEREGNDNAGT